MSSVRNGFLHKIDYLIGGYCSCARCSDSNLAAALVGEKSEGLANSIAVEESVLLRIGQRFAEMLDYVVFKPESVVIEQFLGHLNRNVQLVCVKVNLSKGRVTERQRSALVNPRCGGLGCRNVYLVFAAGVMV